MAKTKKSNGKGEKNGTNGTRSEGVERRRFVENLPIPADPKTIAKASANFARLVSEEEELQEERREAMAGFKSRKNAIDESMRKWRDTVEKGTELAAVECVEILIVETNEVQKKRLDTGEILETRAAEAQDRQEVLGLDATGKTQAERDAFNAGEHKTEEAKKGTAASRKKRGGKTTVVAAADAE